MVAGKDGTAGRDFACLEFNLKGGKTALDYSVYGAMNLKYKH